MKTPPVIAFSLFITGCFLIFIERFHHIGNKTEKTMGWTGALPLAVAFIASFVFSILSIKWLINFLNKSRLTYFALYCFVLALFVFFYFDDSVIMELN